MIQGVAFGIGIGVGIGIAGLRKRGRENTTLKPTTLIKFTKREGTGLTKLEVYDSNIMTPVGRALWYAVRDEYKLIFNKFEAVVQKKKDRERCLLILGNSGIGKSIGLDDILRRVLDSSDGFGFLLIVVVAIRGDYILFRRSTNDAWSAYSCLVHHEATQASVNFLEQVSGSDRDKKVLLLHDVKSTERNTLRFDSEFATYLGSTFCTTVVVAPAPKEANYRTVQDEFAACTTFWCVCWEADEARELWSLREGGAEEDAEEFDEAFFNIGGVPRHLLSDKANPFLRIAKEWMWGLTYEELHKPVNTNVSHCISLAVPNQDRTFVKHYTFVSKGVEHEWHRQGKAVAVDVLRMQYHKCVDDGLPGGTCGDFFERLILARLLEGSTTPLVLHRVFPKGPKTGTNPEKSSTTTIDVSKIAKMAVPFGGSDATAVVKVDTPTVFVPINQQFPFVDFLIVYPDGSVTGIQSTVNKYQHQPTPSTFEKVFAPLKTNGLQLTMIVWAVPRTDEISMWQPLEDETKAKATKALRNHYGKIPQYVLHE